MGNYYHTEMAYLNIASKDVPQELLALDGALISTADARMLKEKYSDYADFIKYNHAILNSLPVKFSPSNKHEDYFSLNSAPKNLTDTDKRHLQMHPLHKYASDFIASDNFDSIELDGVVINRSNMLIHYGDSLRLYYTEKDYIIPDAVISTPSDTYYIEFYNTNKVDSKKIAKYRKIYSSAELPFKVVEIDISDLCKKMMTEPSLDWTALVEKRIIGVSKYKKVLDLKPKKSKDFAPFGRCFACGTPLELRANTSDENYSSRLIKKIKRIHLSIKGVAETDRVSSGSAVTYCPHCKAENRVLPLYCPECLTQRGKRVPLKVLTSGAGRTFLHCPFNLMLSELEHDVKVDEKDACNFSMTIYDEHGNYDRQLKAVGNFDKLYQKNVGVKCNRKLKEAEAIAKKNKEWKGN